MRNYFENQNITEISNPEFSDVVFRLIIKTIMIMTIDFLLKHLSI